MSPVGGGEHLFCLSCQYNWEVNTFPEKAMCGSKVEEVDWPHAASLGEGGRRSRRIKNFTP